jgi:hypothetical protein
METQEEKKQIVEIILTDLEKLLIENINLKQEIISFRFNELNTEAMRLREENVKILNQIAEKNQLVIGTDKRISLNGNKLIIE